MLSIRALRVALGDETRPVHALRGVDMALVPGKATGLVGETGSGKTLTALAALGLLPPSARILSGTIRWEGRDLLELDEAGWERIRGREIAMIFQNARAALHPLLPIGRQLIRVRQLHRGGTTEETRKDTLAMLESVGLSDASKHMDAYPHQLSGGQCQRVMCAMALLCRPKVLIADEPTSSLDVTIQQQLLFALATQIENAGTTLLLISHDLSVVRELCDFVAVMYAGRVVEYGPKQAVLGSPAHPYTKALLRCLSPSGKRLPFIRGEVPDPRRAHETCAFANRCEAVFDRCTREDPAFTQVSPGHGASCFLHGPTC